MNSINIRIFSLGCCFLMITSCGLRLPKNHQATNHDKLSRVYVIEENEKKLIFKTKEEWLTYCNSQNPWGYTVLRKGDTDFTGKVIRVFRKNRFSKPLAYAIFNYKNGFIEGHYAYYSYKTGKKFIEGEAAVDMSSKNEGSTKSDLCEMFSPGLNSLELNSQRKEYILREKCTNSEGKLISWFVRDSLCIKVSNIRNIDKKFCIETKHETQYFSSELRVTPENDTLYYEYRSSDFFQIICKESQPAFEPYYIHPHETYSRRVTYDRRTTDGKRANEYFLPYTLLNLQYNDSWGRLDGYIFTETPNYALATTLSGDTLEYVQMLDKKKQGLMKRTHPDGRIIELINFDNNNLHGEWIAFDGKGDTVFIFNYEHGEKHGLWKTQLEEYTYENGVINGRVRIYEIERFFSGLKNLEPVKYLVQDYYMKDGRKHGSYKSYYTDNWESTYVNGLSSEATYFNGMLMGEKRSYYPDGTLMEVANYDHGKEHGCFVHYKKKPGDREIQYRYFYEYGQKISGAEVNCY